MPKQLYQAVAAVNRSDSKPVINIDGEDIPYAGDELSPGVMKAWKFSAYATARTINPRFATAIQAGQQGLLFVHVTKATVIGTGFNERAITATGDDKEFGPGFYTMAADTLINGEVDVLGGEWFQKKQETPHWSVVGINISNQIPSWFLEVAGGGARTHLLFYLTHSVGHPSGNLVPDASDISIMEQINFLGKVLILPDDDTPVRHASNNVNTIKASTIAAAQGGNLPGDPWVVIGPQKPVYMKARQIAWKFGVGLWMINSSERVVLYNNGNAPGL